MDRKGAATFGIENNILIGEELPIIDKNNSLNVGHLILTSLKSIPQFIGQVDAATEEQSTYQQMKERSVKCALWLKKQDVIPGDIVVICTHNHLGTYIPYFASLYIGAIANPWNEQSTKVTMKHFLSQVEPKVIFVDDNKASTVQEVITELHISAKIVVFREVEGFQSLESILNEPCDETEIDEFSCTKLTDVPHVAAIVFSSGTTGLPKGVEISHASLITPTNFHLPVMKIGDIALWFGSLNWVTSVLLTIRTIICRIRVIKATGFDADKLCKIIMTHKVTWVLLETSTSNRLLKSDVFENYDVSSLKRIVFGGSPIKREVQEALFSLLPNVFITTIYGMTETSGLTQQPDIGKAGSTGFVAKNVRLMIADTDTGKPLGPNMRGEIYCKTPAMMNGYYKKPEETKKAFDDDGWFHTGDLGYYDEDGEVFVIDRIKELIKYRGYQIAPAEIEGLLQTHPAIVEAVVIGVPHFLDSQHSIAFVEKIPCVDVTVTELEQLVADNLEDWKRLRGGVVFLHKIPHLPNGKIDREELRVMANLMYMKT